MTTAVVLSLASDGLRCDDSPVGRHSGSARVRVIIRAENIGNCRNVWIAYPAEMAGYESSVSSGNPPGLSVDYTRRNRPSRNYENPLYTSWLPATSRCVETEASTPRGQASGFANGHVYVVALWHRVLDVELTARPHQSDWNIWTKSYWRLAGRWRCFSRISRAMDLLPFTRRVHLRREDSSSNSLYVSMQNNTKVTENQIVKVYDYLCVIRCCHVG